MKKRIAVTTILGLLLLSLASVAFALMGKVVSMLKGAQIAGPRLILNNIMKFVEAEFQKMDIMSIVIISLAGVIILLVIIQLIMLIRKKHGAAVWVTIAGILFAFLTFAFLTITLVPGQSIANGNALYTVTLNGTTYTAEGIKFGAYLLFVRCIQAKQWIALLYFIAPVLFLIGFILCLVGLCSDMKLLAGLPKPVKAKQSDDEVVVIHDEDLESEESRAAAENALAAGGYPERHNAQMPVPPAAGLQGPFLIQYINTYAPAESAKKVPVEEIQGNINDQKPLSADDIRKIIQEELGEKKEQPVIVNVPAAPKEEPKGVSPDEVRKILSEELGRYLASEKEDIEPEETEILVEEEPVPALTKEEVREIIASELAKNKPEEKEEEEEPVDIRAVIRDELEAHRRELDEEAKRKAAEEEAEKARQEELERARAEAAEAARKEEAEKKPVLTAEDIRTIVAEELGKKEPEEPKEEQDIREIIREVIRDELKDAAPVQEEPVAPVVNIIVKKAEEQPAPEPAPEVAPEPVVVAAEPAPEPAQKIIRIPFPERMLSADDDLRSNYNELKSEILSYGDVKSRVSNTGDTFRAHTVTFVKITIAGKGLKLYFALDPKDYANSTLPVQDASAKAIYRDIPLVFKVKSELSLRRAKQLIADVMEKNGYEQGKIEKRDWAADLKNYKPAGGKDDDDEDDDE